MTTASVPGGIADWIVRRAQRSPDRIAVVDADGGSEWTYAQLADRMHGTATGLRDLGVRSGDRVLIVLDNCPEFIEYVFAVASVGAIAVPVNFRLSAGEIAYLISDAQPVVVVHNERFAGLTKDALDGAALSPRVVDVDTAPAYVPGHSRTVAAVDDDDVCMIMYTSGTTGRPKGAMITHGHLRWNTFNILTVDGGVSSSDVTLSVAPLFHIGAFGLLTLPLLYVGGTVVLQRAFSPRETLAAFERHSVTICFLVPAMWAALAQVADFDSFDVAAMRFVLSGGAPCPLPVIRFFQGKGWAFLEGFGMTEFGPSTLLLDDAHVVSHAGTVGRPFLHTDVAIVDEFDRPVRDGDVGELILRGPTTFAGYWGLPDATSEALRGGWFHSGDLARSDAEGFVTIVDRKKDMVITGGENVYPAEVEHMLREHPEVADVAVIGVPDERWGEAVTATSCPPTVRR